MTGPDDDPLPEAVSLVGAAASGPETPAARRARVRALCPDFPPRRRACDAWTWPACPRPPVGDVAAYLEESGCVPDKMFNLLNGYWDTYFTAPSGRAIDVMVDRLVMCHTLDFRPSFGNSSDTLDPADLLLSKLQIFELNAKDAHDITHLLAGLPSDAPSSAGPRVDVSHPASTRPSGRTGAGGGPRRGTWRSCRAARREPGHGPGPTPERPAGPGGAAARRAASAPKS